MAEGIISLPEVVTDLVNNYPKVTSRTAVQERNLAQSSTIWGFRTYRTEFEHETN